MAGVGWDAACVEGTRLWPRTVHRLSVSSLCRLVSPIWSVNALASIARQPHHARSGAAEARCRARRKWPLVQGAVLCGTHSAKPRLQTSTNTCVAPAPDRHGGARKTTKRGVDVEPAVFCTHPLREPSDQFRCSAMSYGKHQRRATVRKDPGTGTTRSLIF